MPDSSSYAHSVEVSGPLGHTTVYGTVVVPEGAPLEKVHVPVLIIIGKKDLQVDWQADAAPLQRAAAERTNVSFLYPDNANHVLKYELRPRENLAQAEVMLKYNADDASLEAETVAAIVGWLAARA